MSDKMVNNRIVAYLFICLLIFFSCISYGLTADASENTITVSTVRGDLGDTVFLYLIASYIKTAGFQLEIFYDEETLELQDSVQGKRIIDLINNGSITINDKSKGFIRLLFYHHENVVIREIVKMEFKVISEINGVSAVYIDKNSDYNEIYDENVEPININYISGGVRGRDRSYIVDNGEIGVSDAILILRHVVGLVDIGKVYGLEALQRAKVTGGEGPSVADAIAILRFIVGLNDSFFIQVLKI